MKTRKIITRLLVVLAFAIFVGSAISEVVADSSLPDELRVWKNHHSLRSGAFTVLALVSILLGLISYACAMFVQRWAAFIVLAHVAAFVAANAVMGPHVYMGQTQALFLLYMFVVGSLVAALCQKSEPNQRPEGTPGKSSPSNPSQPPGVPHP